MKNALSGLKVRPKRRAKGSPRTGETSADLYRSLLESSDLSRSIPTSPPSGAPVKQPGWRDLKSYDPQVLSAAAGRGITSALEGMAQTFGGARDYLGGFMQSVRERSPVELQGTAPARSKETYESVNRAVSQAAQDPLTTAKNLASAFVDVGVQAAKSPASMTEFIASNLTPGGRSKPVMTQVVKPKGGDFPKRLEAVESMKLFEPDTEGMQLGANASTKEAAVNNWLGTKLDRYIRNEMATPEDPIRKLAEQGILHVNPDMINYDPVRYGDPDLGPKVQALMAESPAAQVWEGATDYMMGSGMRLGKLAKTDPSAPGLKRFMDENPWVYKVAQADPDRKLYLPSEDIGRDLGFDHLRDELLNSIDAESGLPQQLRLTNEQLGRMSVPDAVRHVSKINKWREKKKAEANFALANNAATVSFKDYPGQKYGWFQLRADTPEGEQALSDALRYEGDMMGHCVGGYCDNVLSGATQIYSLRNKSTGEPHVTIEVEPIGVPFARFKARVDQLYSHLDENERMKILFDTGYVDENGIPVNFPSSIRQIKGKANQAPRDEYLPFVQDFVKSGHWESVRDLQNTKLFDLKNLQPTGSPGRQVTSWIDSKGSREAAQLVLIDFQAANQRYASEQELNDAYMQLIRQRNAERRAARPGTPEERRAARREARQNRRNQED
jgi:hypothetical protein